MKIKLMMIFAAALALDTTVQAAQPQPPKTKPTATAVPASAPAAAPAPASAPAAPAAAPVAPGTNAPASPFKNDQEKAGYALGANLGSNLSNNWKRQGLKPGMFDMDAFVHGLKDAFGGNPPLLTPEETRATLAQLKQTVMQQIKTQALHNKADGEKFLADNQTNAGVATLPDGLQYKILTAGSGESPKASDTVSVNYRGKLIDGTEFDSSYKRGQPASFRVGGVIHGWTEALQLMKPGAKWQLFIPANLAYGEAGNPPVIPPNSTLVFDVELISITPGPAMPPMLPGTPGAPGAQPVTSDIIRVPSADELKHGAKIETIKADQLQQYTNSAVK